MADTQQLTWVQQNAGKWTGDLAVLSRTGEVSRLVSRVKVQPTETGWTEQRTLADGSGAILSQHTWVYEDRGGVATVAVTDEGLGGCTGEGRVAGPVLTLVLRDTATGQPRVVETTTLTNGQRVRSIQTYDGAGAFVSMSVAEEQRVG